VQLQELKEKLEKKRSKQLISSQILLGKFRLLDEKSRSSGPYQDPLFAPFYYQLGKLISPKSFLEVGFRLGLLSGCFLKSCKSVERFLAFQPVADEFYSPRLAAANIRDVYKKEFDSYIGNLTDVEFEQKLKSKFDIVCVNEQLTYDKMRDCLDLMWENINLDGYLVLNYVDSYEPNKDAFETLCKVVQREPIYFKTRYGTAIVQK
jgi:hypothetical protein